MLKKKLGIATQEKQKAFAQLLEQIGPNIETFIENAVEHGYTSISSLDITYVTTKQQSEDVNTFVGQSGDMVKMILKMDCEPLTKPIILIGSK